jgi:hypothetical protein
MKLYRNHRDPVRELDQVTGANVLRPSAWTKGANPPRVLIRAPKIETSFDEDHDMRTGSAAQ